MNRKAFLIVCCVVTLSCASSGSTVDPCFNPGGNCLSEVIAEIGKAKSQILVQAATLNAKPLADALIKAKEAGVKIEIILSHAAQNNAVYFSSLNGIPTHLDARHIVSDNVIIIDQSTVIAGSFKLTKAEDKNAENVMIVRAADVADSYRENWEQHKAHSETFKAATAQSRPESVAEKKTVKRKKKTN